MCVCSNMKSKGMSLCFDSLLLMLGIVTCHGGTFSDTGLTDTEGKITASLSGSTLIMDSAHVLAFQSDRSYLLSSEATLVTTSLPFEKPEPNISPVHSNIDRTITSSHSPSVESLPQGTYLLNRDSIKNTPELTEHTALAPTKAFRDVDISVFLTESLQTERSLLQSSEVPVSLRFGGSPLSDSPTVPAESAISGTMQQQNIYLNTAEYHSPGAETEDEEENAFSVESPISSESFEKHIIPTKIHIDLKTEAPQLFSHTLNQQKAEGNQKSLLKSSFSEFLESSFALDPEFINKHKASSASPAEAETTTPYQFKGLLEVSQLHNSSPHATPSLDSQTPLASLLISSLNDLQGVTPVSVDHIRASHTSSQSGFPIDSNYSKDYESEIPNLGAFQKRFGDHYIEYEDEDSFLAEESEKIESLGREDLGLEHGLRTLINANLEGSFWPPPVGSTLTSKGPTRMLPKMGSSTQNMEDFPSSFSSRYTRSPSRSTLPISGTHSEFLVIVNPSTQRTSKEMAFTTDIPSPTLNAEDVSQIVSILKDNTPDISMGEASSQEVSVFMRDASDSLIMKNKTSRNDNPHLDDIISGIIHLLAGDVQVVRQPPPKFQHVHAPVPRPIRPTTTRINNRGPPLLTGQSRTVVVFSQPVPHMAIRPNPPMLPPVRLRPSTTKINNFQTAAGVTHFINIRPSRPDKNNAATPSIVHLYKPLLNPHEINNFGHISHDDGSIISVLRPQPPLGSDSIREVVRLTEAPPGKVHFHHEASTEIMSHPAHKDGKKPELTPPQDSYEELPSSDEETIAPLLYDEYYEDASESEELKEIVAPDLNSKTFEVFRDPPTVDTKLILHPATVDLQITSSLQSSTVSPHIETTSTQFSSSESSIIKEEIDEAVSGGTNMPSGPVTDWVPFLEPPSTKPGFDLVGQGATNTLKVTPTKEIVIITQPTIFDLTVTNTIAGVQPVPPPLAPINSSGPKKSSPMVSNGIVETNDHSLPLTKLSESQMANMHSLIISTASDSGILPTKHVETSILSSRITKSQHHPLNSPQDIPVSSLVPPHKPQIVYGRPHSVLEQESPPRVDNLSKYRHDPSARNITSKPDIPEEDVVTVIGKGSVKPKVIPPSMSSSSNSSASSPTRLGSGGPLLGRPIVVPVDIEEVRPFVGAINPPRQGARPTFNRGNRPPPGFSGPPPPGVGNVQVAQAGVNVAEDSRNRSPGARPPPLLTSRPPLVRTQPRPRPNSPLVRIDTCIVGDDSTCDLQMNETCKTEQGVSSCQCRPGFARSFTRGPCQPIVSVMLSLKVDRFGDQRLAFSPKYQDPNSEEYRLMEFEAKQALSSLFSNTAFARNFMGVTVNKFYSIGGRLIINATVQLEEKESTRVHSLRLQMRQEVVQAINSRNQNIGDSRLYVEGPLNPVPAVEDVNECAEGDLNDCSENGVCVNVFGTYQCKCRLGYLDPYPNDERMSGRKCSACSVDYCSNHGQCIVENGLKMCKCRGNYIGSRCEIDGEVLGVALGATLAAVIIIILTLACLCIWNRRWKREQQKAEAMSARSVNSIQTYSYLNKMTNSNAYRLTMEDRMRWAHIADVMGSNYAQTENGSTPMQNAVVPTNQGVYMGPSRCHSPNGDEASWYNYNSRPRSRAATSHTPTPLNSTYYDMDYSTRETYVGPGYAPSTRYMPPNVMRNYYS